MRIVFIGTSEFAVPALRALAGEHELALVVTQPPKPAGRGLRLTPTPVGEAAAQLHVAVLTPAKLDEGAVAQIRDIRAGLLVCVAYGRLVPSALLDLPHAPALNVHPSLLPRYRGATPIRTALRDGVRETGVTIIWMSNAMDAGDIALCRPVEVSPDDDHGVLHDRLATVGAQLALEAARLVASGDLPRRPQDESQATYTTPLSKDDLRLDFAKPAAAVVNQVRSLAPTPAGWMLYEGRRLKVVRAHPEAHDGGAPGTILAREGQGPVIACAAGSIRLLEVIPESKGLMTGAEFVRGRR